MALIGFAAYQLLRLPLTQLLDMPWFHSWLWFRWDAGHYLKIAENGYTYFSCAELEGFPKNTDAMCGTTGWFPGYPLLIRWFRFGADYILVGSIISKVFFFITLFLTSFLLKIKKINAKNIILIFIAVFGFGSIYYQAIFPMSATLTFMLLAIIFFQKKKFWMVAISCFIVSFMYSTGFLLSIVLGLALMFESKTDFKDRFINAAIINIFGALGVLLFFALLQIEVGEWAAFINVQAKYGHGFETPWKRIGAMLNSIPKPLFVLTNVIYLQSIVVLIGYLVISFYFITKKWYQDKLKLIAYIFISAYIIFPWTIGGNLSMYRAESLLLPVVFLLKDLRIKTLIAILIIEIALWLPMSYLFLDSILV